MPSLPLSTQVFTILAGLVEDRAGLHYRPEDRELLGDKVSLRAQELGFDSLLDYYYFLRYDPGGPAELDHLLEILLVHETYFFREADQLRVLVNQLLGPALEAGKELRIWCAACATGEEPLTLAMMLADRGASKQVRIVASDLSDRALSRARGGVFSQRSLRALPEGVLGRWLSKDGDRYAIDGALLRSIEWRKVNLVERVEVDALGAFDAILCRNVLIYFGDDTARAVVGRLSGALIPGAWLLVGASESLLRYGTSLACEEHGGAFFYRRLP